MTGKEIAAALQLSPRAIPDLPDALVALKFLQRDRDGPDARYSNTPESAFFLDRTSPGYIGGILEMANARLYRFWADLTEALKTARSARGRRGLRTTAPRQQRWSRTSMHETAQQHSCLHVPLIGRAAAPAGARGGALRRSGVPLHCHDSGYLPSRRRFISRRPSNRSFGERSLRRALSEYVEHFHAERNHQGKGNVLLFPRDTDICRGPVQSRERLGGLLRYYHREAA